MSYPVLAATENNPVSVCAYCIDSHAGIMWITHESQEQLGPFDPGRITKVDIAFKCFITEEVVSCYS